MKVLLHRDERRIMMFKVVSKKTGEIRIVYAVRDNGPLLQFLMFDNSNCKWVWGLASDFVPYISE